MCAINGFNLKDEGLIIKMNQLTCHRGPDDTGIFLDDLVSLGHNRLSIIDLSSAGHQPMLSEDKRLAIVFNGEIFNFKELRKELNGYFFRSDSDTEVILAAYERWRSDCVKKFNGIFSFAIWDGIKKELFLARDHVGIKPLYYFWNGRKLIFSSEIKAILAHDVSREIDLEALNHYFKLSYVPQPFTIFKNIKKLPAGHWLCLKNGRIEVKKYWSIQNRNDFESKDQALEEIKNNLEDSVKLQLVSDRPVGVFLSGGVDSSVILGLVRKLAPNIAKTYTTGFKVDAEQEKFNVDFHLARQTAKFYKTDHNELLIGPDDIYNNLEKIAWHLDEPNGNHTAPAIFLLSGVAKKNVAVVLGGDGGDELFGGYQRYVFSGLISRYNKMPYYFQRAIKLLLNLAGRKQYEEKLSTAGANRIAAFMSMSNALLSGVLKPEIFNSIATKNYFSDILSEYPDDVIQSDFEKVFMDIDRRTWLTDDSLMRTDKMSMAHGLELRVPILDKRLIEISQRIPTSWKIKRKTGKIIFRNAFSEYILPHLANRPKSGWFTPMAKWLRVEPLKSFAIDVINSLPDEYFQKKQIKIIFNDHCEKKAYNLNILWYLIAFGVWRNAYDKMG